MAYGCAEDVHNTAFDNYRFQIGTAFIVFYFTPPKVQNKNKSSEKIKKFQKLLLRA